MIEMGRNTNGERTYPGKGKQTPESRAAEDARISRQTGGMGRKGGSKK